MATERERPTVELCMEVISETEKAYRLWDGTGRISNGAQWVPKSQIVSISQGNHRSPNTRNVTMYEWIAKEKGFI